MGASLITRRLRPASLKYRKMTGHLRRAPHRIQGTSLLRIRRDWCRSSGRTVDPLLR